MYIEDIVRHSNIDKLNMKLHNLIQFTYTKLSSIIIKHMYFSSINAKQQDGPHSGP